MSEATLEIVVPSWPAPANVHAAATTRLGGASRFPWNSLNLARHVGDAPEAVAENRARLRRRLALPAEPRWLDQRHGTRIVAPDDPDRRADGSVTSRSGEVLAVLTADCLPVLLCDRGGTFAAAVHAGWRGLAAGVLEAAVTASPVPAGELLAWIGPAIGPDAYEIGTDVRDALVATDDEAGGCLRANRAGHWLADLPGLAARRLRRLGIGGVHGGDLCTASDTRRFYSFRREGRTGRLATLIWLGAEEPPALG